MLIYQLLNPYVQQYLGVDEPNDTWLSNNLYEV